VRKLDKQICLYCNALAELHLNCPACGGAMEDYGALQDILGPYAPYEENEAPRENYSCIHQLYCPNCHETYQYHISTENN